MGRSGIKETILRVPTENEDKTHRDLFTLKWDDYESRKKEHNQGKRKVNNLYEAPEVAFDRRGAYLEIATYLASSLLDGKVFTYQSSDLELHAFDFLKETFPHIFALPAGDEILQKILGNFEIYLDPVVGKDQLKKSLGLH